MKMVPISICTVKHIVRCIAFNCMILCVLVTGTESTNTLKLRQDGREKGKRSFKSKLDKQKIREWIFVPPWHSPFFRHTKQVSHH